MDVVAVIVVVFEVVEVTLNQKKRSKNREKRPLGGLPSIIVVVQLQHETMRYVDEMAC